MKREIKFRGKDDLGNWFYGSLLSEYHSSRFGLIDAICYNEDLKTKRIPIDRDTIGQFTGLKDKNGVEIYEGDNITCYNHDSDNYYGGVVTYCLDDYKFVLIDNNGCYNDLYKYHKPQVIGNIHEL